VVCYTRHWAGTVVLTYCHRLHSLTLSDISRDLTRFVCYVQRAYGSSHTSTSTGAYDSLTDLATMTISTLPSLVASFEPPQLESQSTPVSTLLEAVQIDYVVATPMLEAQPVGLASEAPVQTQTASPSPVVPEGQSARSLDSDVDLSQFEISPRAP
jgi:hypothetical protein